MEYYSALKRNKLSSQKKTGRKLTRILPSERSQSENATYCMIPTLGHSGKGKTMERVVARGGKKLNRWSTKFLEQ